MFGTNLRWTVLGALPGTLILLAGFPADTERAPVAGRFTVKYSQQHAFPVADAAGPVLLANEAKGTNNNTGKTDYMNGATATVVEIADLTQGNGSHQGYVTFVKAGERTVNRWSGRITTTMSPDNQPVTTFEGTWTKIGGTGRYDGVTGSGRYKGRMLSPTELVVDWNGNLALKKTASR